MALIEPGKVCVLLKGADAGKEVVIKEVVDKNFVIITGKDVKERRSNIKHLEFTGRKEAIPKGKEPKVKKVEKEKVSEKKAVKKEAKKEKAQKEEK